MADTQRSVSSILALLADNTSGDISPQDIRDAFVSWRMSHGQIYVPVASAAAVTISNTSSYFEATEPAWTLSSGAHLFDESSGNGRLTYTGAVTSTIHVACTISMTCASNNQVLHARLGVDGTTDETSEVIIKVGTGADVVSTAAHLLIDISPGSHISLWLRNETSSANITIQAANIQCVGMSA